MNRISSTVFDQGLALILSAIFSLLVPLQGYACSKMAFGSTLSLKSAYLIATATADTLLAGPGAVSYSIASGHFGRAVDRPIYGQVVHVHRLGGLSVSSQGLPTSGDTRAIIVPWDYGSDCTPTPWAQNWQWVEPGTTGFFWTALRDSAYWIDGLPTFDEFSPQFAPYPQRLDPMVFRDEPVDSTELLTPEALFELVAVLPLRSHFIDAPDEAAAPLFQWAREHPHLARRYPAGGILWRTRSSIASIKLRKIIPPLRGTYRFTLTRTDGPPLTFFGRTDENATTEWHLRYSVSRRPRRTRSQPPEAYYMQTSSALTPEDLPLTTVERWESKTPTGYLSVVAQPEPDVDGNEIWKGMVWLDFVGRQFREDAALLQFHQAYNEQLFDKQWRDRRPPETPATFTHFPDGRVQVEQTLDLGDGRVLTIHGERISMQTIVIPEEENP